MSVVILALFAVIAGFVLITFMGKAPEGMVIEDAGEAASDKPQAHFPSIESFEETAVRLIEAQGMKISQVRRVGPDEFEVFGLSGEGLGQGLVIFHCLLAGEPVGADRVGALQSAVRGERALKGVYITTGYFSADVHNIVEGAPVDFVNVERLTELLLAHQLIAAGTADSPDS